MPRYYVKDEEYFTADEAENIDTDESESESSSESESENEEEARKAAISNLTKQAPHTTQTVNHALNIDQECKTIAEKWQERGVSQDYKEIPTHYFIELNEFFNSLCERKFNGKKATLKEHRVFQNKIFFQLKEYEPFCQFTITSPMAFKAHALSFVKRDTKTFPSDYKNMLFGDFRKAILHPSKNNKTTDVRGKSSSHKKRSTASDRPDTGTKKHRAALSQRDLTSQTLRTTTNTQQNPQTEHLLPRPQTNKQNSFFLPSSPFYHRSPEQELKKCCAHLKQAKENEDPVLVITGAGVSVASGVPDFRSPQGLYTRYEKQGFTAKEIMKYWSLECFYKNPEGPKNLYAMLRLMYTEKYEPSATHIFTKKLKELFGDNLNLVTLNVDGLHLEGNATVQDTIEFHGNLEDHYCTYCKQDYSKKYVKKAIESDQVPICDNSNCNDIIRPSMILYGESLDPDVYEKVSALINDAKYVVVLGSSLKFNDGHLSDIGGILHDALEADTSKKLLIVNDQPTPLDKKATCLMDSLEKFTDYLNEHLIHPAMTEKNIRGLLSLHK